MKPEIKRIIYYVLFFVLGFLLGWIANSFFNATLCGGIVPPPL